VRRSGHFGAAGSYATLAAEEGLIALVTSDTATPAVVPTFGLAPKLGTNPIALAAPAHHNRPFLLDMATSTVPVGRLATAWRRGLRIPIGWANDRKGNPLTDPRLAFEARCLTPLGSVSDMGSHKGYGLAVAVAILSSVLSGSRNQLEHDPVGRVGHFFLALDPAHFRADNTFRADLDDLLDDLRASPAHDPAQPVLVAGDPEYAVAAHRRVHGIPLAPRVFADLREVAEASGVAFTLGERS
jgi:LDH2 family malate/lactate/ureidoglycolate dehydrogenase